MKSLARIFTITAALILTVSLIGQAPPVPKIPLELLKDFYAADAAQQRAQRQLDLAQQAMQSAQTSWKQAVNAMQKACGDQFDLYQDSPGADPACRAKKAEGKK